MNWLNFDLRKAILTAVIILLPLISINTQQKPTSMGWYDKPFSFLAGLIENSFFSFSDNVRGTTKMYIDLINIKKESQDLKNKNSELLARLGSMEELHKENDRLNGLLEFRQHTKMDLVAARVISKDLIADHSTIQIDKGTRNGLKDGQAVITVDGAIGHVFRSDTFTAHVMLVTDRYSVVDGIVSRSRSRGIVEGKGQNGCTLSYVEKSEDVKVGDLIVTSGLDNIFPKGFPLATVKNVENKNFLVSLKVDLTPAVDPRKVEEVFVITNAQNQDLSDRVALNSNPTTNPAAIGPNLNPTATPPKEKKQ